MIHTLKGCRELVASPDTVLFLNKDDYFEAHAEEFGYSIVAELELDNAPESFLVDFSGDNSMSNLFTAMLNCRNDNLASNRYRALGTIYEIFGLISRREEAEYMTSSTEGKLYAMRLYIQEHYSDPTLNMEKLSGISGLSIRHLNVLFNKKYDSSCWQYVIDTRINAASKLLCAPGYSIRNGRGAVRLPRRVLFQKAFQEAYERLAEGVPPRRLRKRIKGQAPPVNGSACSFM